MSKNESRIKNVVEKVTPRKLVATGLTAAALAAAGCAPSSQENTVLERPKAATEKINRKLQSAAQKGSKYVLAVLKKDPTKVITLSLDNGKDVSLTVYVEDTDNYGDYGSKRESNSIEATFGKIVGTSKPDTGDLKSLETTKIVTIKQSGKPTEEFIDSSEIYTPFSDRAVWDATISSDMMRDGKQVSKYSSYENIGGAFEDSGALRTADDVNKQIEESIKFSRKIRNP